MMLTNKNDDVCAALVENKIYVKHLSYSRYDVLQEKIKTTKDFMALDMTRNYLKHKMTGYAGRARLIGTRLIRSST